MLALNLLEEAERQVASLRRENQQFKSLQKEHKQLVGLGVLPAGVLCRAWRALQNELFNAGCGVGTMRMDPPKFFPLQKGDLLTASNLARCNVAAGPVIYHVKRSRSLDCGTR